MNQKFFGWVPARLKRQQIKAAITAQLKAEDTARHIERGVKNARPTPITKRKKFISAMMVIDELIAPRIAATNFTLSDREISELTGETPRQSKRIRALLSDSGAIVLAKRQTNHGEAGTVSLWCVPKTLIEWNKCYTNVRNMTDEEQRALLTPQEYEELMTLKSSLVK